MFQGATIYIKIGLGIGIPAVLISLLISAFFYICKKFKVNWNLDGCTTWFFMRLFMHGAQPRSQHAISAPPVNLIEL